MRLSWRLSPRENLTNRFSPFRSFFQDPQGGIFPRCERLVVGRVHEPPELPPVEEIEDQVHEFLPRTRERPPAAQLTSSNSRTASLRVYFPVMTIGTLSPVWIMAPQEAVE